MFTLINIKLIYNKSLTDKGIAIIREILITKAIWIGEEKAFSDRFEELKTSFAIAINFDSPRKHFFISFLCCSWIKDSRRIERTPSCRAWLLKPENKAMKFDIAWDGNFYGLIKEFEWPRWWAQTGEHLNSGLFRVPIKDAEVFWDSFRIFDDVRTQEVNDQLSHSCDGFWYDCHNFARNLRTGSCESDPSYH